MPRRRPLRRQVLQALLAGKCTVKRLCRVCGSRASYMRLLVHALVKEDLARDVGRELCGARYAVVYGATEKTAAALAGLPLNPDEDARPRAGSGVIAGKKEIRGYVWR